MARPPSKEGGFWTALKALGRAIVNGVNPLPALTDLLSRIEGVLALATILILVLLVFFLVCGRRDSGTRVIEDKPTTTAEPPKTPPDEKDLDEAHASRVVGRDHLKRSATFDVVVWDQRFNWQLGENALVELGGHPVTFPEHLAKPAVQERMAMARALVAVGSASQEIETLALEEQRSDDRASQLATWIEEAINKPTYTLSLGRYQASSKKGAIVPNTKRQRPIAIVGIVDCEDGVVLAESLADALYVTNRSFPFDSHKYVRFDLQPPQLTCQKGQIR